ncbi:MAG: rhodanese-like domain-containing protein [Solirubrobacterales bacterium]
MEASETPEAEHQKSPAEIEQQIADGGARLIDVRQEYEFDAAHLVGAERIGLEELADRRGELDKSEPIIFYCRVGTRSDMAAEAFSAAGYDVKTIRGGITAWVVEGKEIEPADGYVSEPGEAAAILEARARNK